ncbi:MAG: A/G-specific adenine glycosylase [Firmicutes bacterium]|nr:A/G-specific adenine glycosylase [Bacillota bacterium]
MPQEKSERPDILSRNAGNGFSLEDERRTCSWPSVLSEWFLKNARKLPWRENTDPYRVLVAELMLQQTRIETVIPYYLQFMKDYPTAKALAEAPMEEVLKHWEGLGYYSRARNLKKAASLINEANEAGKYPLSAGFPDTWEAIKGLPGVGEYTASAVGAISFSLPAPAVDGNVMRVVSRLYGLWGDVLDPKNRKAVTGLLEAVFPKQTPGAFVQGLMELGELICLPKSPKCQACPIQEACLAFEKGWTEALPVRIPKQKRTTRKMAVVLLRRQDGALLIAKREESGVLGGLWELPNVPLQEGWESALEEKYGIRVTVLDKIKDAKHVFTHMTWMMEVWRAETPDGAASSGMEEGQSAAPGEDSQRIRFASKGELEEEIMLPTAFKKLLPDD